MYAANIFSHLTPTLLPTKWTVRGSAAQSVELTELLATCYVLELACKFDDDNVHLEGDSDCGDCYSQEGKGDSPYSFSI